jgi:hypothetical protein
MKSGARAAAWCSWVMSGECMGRGKVPAAWAVGARRTPKRTLSPLLASYSALERGAAAPDDDARPPQRPPLPPPPPPPPPPPLPEGGRGGSSLAYFCSSASGRPSLPLALASPGMVVVEPLVALAALLEPPPPASPPPPPPALIMSPARSDMPAEARATAARAPPPSLTPARILSPASAVAVGAETSPLLHAHLSRRAVAAASVGGTGLRSLGVAEAAAWEMSRAVSHRVSGVRARRRPQSTIMASRGGV